MKSIIIILILLIIFTALYFIKINMEQQYLVVKPIEFFENTSNPVETGRLADNTFVQSQKIVPNGIFTYPSNIDGSIIDKVKIPANFKINGLLVSKIEQIDIPNTGNMFSIYSSFTIADNENMLSIIKNVPNSVTFIPIQNIPKNELLVSEKDYICFDFPEEIADYLFSKVEIVLNSPYDVEFFKLYTYDSSQGNLFKIPLKQLTKGTTSSTLVYEPEEEKGLYCNLYLVTSNKIQSPITIISVKIYFNVPAIDTSVGETSVAKFLTDNPDEQFPLVLPFSSGESIGCEKLGEQQSCKTFRNIFTNILRLKTPWAIYDGASVGDNNKTLIELGGRTCRNAIISGTAPTIENDENIKYLKGTYNTTIEFPTGSLPKKYTICAVTKYTTPDVNRQQILKSNGTPTLIIGHNLGGYENIINYNGTDYTRVDNISPSSTKWVISCIKSSGTTENNSIIINKEGRGTKYLGEYPMNDGKLIINTTTNDKITCSNFGLSYLMIWDTVLLDAELLAVAKVLDDYINKGTVVALSQINLNTRDGKTPETAGYSAIDIKEQTCTNRNGFYWIKVPGTKNAKEIFCIMDSNCNGGGWMLALKAKQNSSTFNYGSVHWTTNTEFIEQSFDKDFESNGIYMDTTLDAKYSIYNTYPVRECLAIFDSREFNITEEQIKNGAKIDDLYTNPNFKQYGWRWYQSNFNNGNPVTLLEFFKNGYTQFYYTCTNSAYANQLVNYMNSRKFGGNYMNINQFRDIYIKSTNPYPSTKAPYNPLIWSTQRAYLSFGLNNKTPGWNHSVRWGGSFNENDDPYTWWYPAYMPGSNDVSGGIGMESRAYSAGDAIGCCQDNTGQNKSFSFKWFIR